MRMLKIRLVSPASPPWGTKIEALDPDTNEVVGIIPCSKIKFEMDANSDRPLIPSIEISIPMGIFADLDIEALMGSNITVVQEKAQA